MTIPILQFKCHGNLKKYIFINIKCFLFSFNYLEKNQKGSKGYSPFCVQNASLYLSLCQEAGCQWTCASQQATWEKEQPLISSEYFVFSFWIKKRQKQHYNKQM